MVLVFRPTGLLGQQVADRASRAPPDQPRHVESTGGLSAWVRGIGATIAGWPAFYRAAVTENRRRAILLTLIVAAVLVYPMIYQAISSSLTRVLPLPSSTVVVFMLIFAIMAIGLNVVIGFAGLLDLGYVAFYALGAYTAAFLASPHWGGVSVVLFSNVPAELPCIHHVHRPGRGGGRGHVRRAPRCANAATPGRLPRHRDPRVRQDRPIFFKNLVNVTFSFGPIQLVNANLTGGPLESIPSMPRACSGSSSVSSMDSRRSTSGSGSS